jgi:hypothetical protein
MTNLSKHYALLNFDPGNPLSVPVEPISCSVTLDETFSPYVQATVVLPTGFVPEGLDPRNATFLGLRLQQDFGNILYVYEITADFAGVVSAITAAYGGSVSAITAAYATSWNVFEDYSPPAPSTLFDGYLMLRSIEKNYLNGETTLELSSHEAILIDSISYPARPAVNYSNLRSLINDVLAETISVFTQLQPGAANYTYGSLYPFVWQPNQTAWDVLDALVKAADLVLYCDEKGDWYLDYAAATIGELVLKDTDNITTLSSRIDRNSSNFFDYAVVEFEQPNGTKTFDSFGVSGFDISKDAYFKIEGVNDPGGNAAQSLVWRAVTRGEIYNVEAVNNYDARPRQSLTIEVTGDPDKTAVIQSLTFNLPSARMSIDIRDLQEVI